MSGNPFVNLLLFPLLNYLSFPLDIEIEFCTSLSFVTGTSNRMRSAISLSPSFPLLLNACLPVARRGRGVNLISETNSIFYFKLFVFPHRDIKPD
jgi:hypothetical protein